MVKPYKPTITQGAPNGFNPACNQTQPAVFSNKQPSSAERAAEGMRKHAAYRAQEEAFKAARAAGRKGDREVPQRRMLRPDEID